MSTGNQQHRERVTDLHYLVGLSEGNQEFVKEMVQTFISENPKELQEVEKGISERDFNLIRHGAHSMKSTIPFVGIDTLIGRAVAEIEQLAKRKEGLSKIEELFASVRDVCHRAITELNAG
jgi:HPt (histidine-containing phosphotransfer) domain-containing protein